MYEEIQYAATAGSPCSGLGHAIVCMPKYLRGKVVDRFVFRSTEINLHCFLVHLDLGLSFLQTRSFKSASSTSPLFMVLG